MKYFNIDICIALSYKLKGEEKRAMNYLGGITFELGKQIEDIDYFGRRVEWKGPFDALTNHLHDYLAEIGEEMCCIDIDYTRKPYPYMHMSSQYMLTFPACDEHFNGRGKLGFIFKEDEEEAFKMMLEMVKQGINDPAFMVGEKAVMDAMLANPDLRILRIPGTDPEDYDHNVLPAYPISAKELGLTDISYEWKNSYSINPPFKLESIGVLEKGD